MREAPGNAFRLERSQWVPLPPGPCFKFFSEPHNLTLITPAWLGLRILRITTPEIREGTLIEYRIRWLALPLRWQAVIRRFDPPRSFVDEQIRGPYRRWLHTHRFEAGAGGTWIRDAIDYALPLGDFGVLVHSILVRRQLEAIFSHRARRIREILVEKHEG